jgi:inner membrane protein
MDPLTQGLLGATFGQALYGRALGRRAVVWGALIGVSPDLDITLSATGPMGEWLYHRGPTHALWIAPVIGPLLGWGLWRWKGGRLRDWIGLALVALVTHPLLDIFTSYGTQLLSPLSNRRFGLDAVAIVDPAYSLLLAAALVFGLRWGTEMAASRVVALGALVLTTTYLFLGLAVNHRAKAVARAQLEAEGVRDARLDAYPTLFQLPYRRLVARRADEVRVGGLSILAPRPIRWERFREARGPLVDAARGTFEARVLEWFASGQTAATVVEDPPSGVAVEIDDLRYGFPGDPRHGLWAVRVRFDAAGRPVGAGERIERPLPASAGQLLGQMWRQAFGAGAP